MNWLHKALKPMDFLIAAVGFYLFLFDIDYKNMSVIDAAYAVCFGIWTVLLIVRCYIVRKGERENKDDK